MAVKYAEYSLCSIADQNQVDVVLRKHELLELATGPGNPAGVQVLTGKTLWFGSRPIRIPGLLGLWGANSDRT